MNFLVITRFVHGVQYWTSGNNKKIHLIHYFCMFCCLYSWSIEYPFFWCTISHINIQWNITKKNHVHFHARSKATFRPLLNMEEWSTSFGSTDPFLGMCREFNAVCDHYESDMSRSVFLNCIRSVRPLSTWHDCTNLRYWNLWSVEF